MKRCPACDVVISDSQTKCDTCAQLKATTPPGEDVLVPLSDTSENNSDGFDASSQKTVTPESMPYPDPASQGAIHTQMFVEDVETARITREIEIPVSLKIRQKEVDARREKAEQAQVEGPWEVLSREALNVYYRMSRIDRLTLFCLLVAFVGAFLPWSFKAGLGYVSGIVDLGLFAALLSAAFGSVMFFRVNYRRYSFIFLMLQLVIATLCTAVPLYEFTSLAKGSVPAIGLFVCLGGGGGGVVFTILRILRSS